MVAKIPSQKASGKGLMSQVRDTPAFLYGTAWKEEQTTELAEAAIQQGFRGLDTANQRKHYFEKAVGKAIFNQIEKGTVSRDDLFIQTKFTHLNGQDHRLPYEADAPVSKQVNQSFAKSLEHLQTDRIDSLVLHGPSQGVGLAAQDWEAWFAMEEVHRAGSTGVLGVSNFSAEQLSTLLEKADVKPSFVQNRCFAAAGWDRQVRQICNESDIIYQGFSLLTANRHVWGSERVASIGKLHDITPAQVIFCLALELDMLPLTGTSNVEHMRDDLSCKRGVLKPDEVRQLETIAIR